MKIWWNKVTWYSKVFAIILFVVVFYVGFNLGQQKKEISTNADTNPVKKVESTSVPVSISTKSIKETNFIGTMPEITGSSVVAVKARAYIDQTIADFRKQANIDVPDMRAKFGADSPTAQYEIDIDAKYSKGDKTESIVMSVYEYTGGANGNSSYKVLTASLASSKILTLSSVIKKDEQIAFTALVKKELNSWSPDGSDTSPVFPDDVKNLTFSSFVNWSLDGENLIIYFNKYDIGPGVLGAVAFPVSLEKIKSMMAI
jgi:hypothetical protein